MKYFIRIQLMFAIASILTVLSYAETIKFSYDNSGNRIAREIVFFHKVGR